MHEVLRAVPGLFWLAAVCTGLALWSDDIRGIYIAAFCATLGTIQLFYSPTK